MGRLFFICLLIASFSQVRGQVSGKIQDVQGAPVPFANVVLLKDSSIFKGAVADELGYYHIADVPAGEYAMRINAIGYQVLNLAAFNVNGATAMGIQTLQTNQQQLGEVVVKGSKPLYQQREDGVVVNVESSIMSKGSVALDVLERAPGIIIDHRNGGISLNGKSGVTVLINGRVLRMPVAQVIAMLQSMRADDIEKIELLTTPGAGYDAEGAGIINIVLKKNTQPGLNGSVSVTAGYGWGEKGGTTLQAGYNTGKTSYYGSYSFNHNRENSNWHAVGTAEEPLLGGLTYSDVTGVMQPVDNSHNVRVGFDKAHWGGSLFYGNSHTHLHNINSGWFTVLPDSLLYNHVDVNEFMRWNNLIADVYVEGKHVSLNADYLRYTNNRPSRAVNSFINDKGEQIGQNDTLFAPVQEGYAHTQIDVGVVKGDYTKQLNTKLKFDAGVKGNYTRTRSLSGISSLVDGKLVHGAGTQNDGLMKEWIAAGYASLHWQLDSSMALTVGGRYEYADTRLEAIHRQLGKLFPTVSFTKQFNGGHELLLSYTKRISRPAYTDLASYKSYTGPNSFETGNPALLPTISNVFKLGYNFKGYSFAILASRDDHPIVRWQMTETPDKSVLIVSSQNMLWQHFLNLQMNIPVKVTDWWRMNYSVIAAWRHFREEYTRQPAEKQYFTTNVSFSEAFTLPEGWSAELSGWYNGPAYDGSKKVDGFGVMNVGVKKELGKGSLQFSVQDVLRTLHIPFYYGRLAEEAHDLQTKVVYSAESTYFPIMRLTYFRAFGSSSGKQRQAAKEEQDRVK